uniref:TBC1 domain-containing protein n=1 Tax=Seriola lalandi dorsalis TaxID=1841481 RepID=A0A3B4XAQ9_SERLL
MSELLVCSPAGVRRKELLAREEEEEEEGAGEEEESRRNMDVSLLREQYRSSRETQRRQTQLLLFRTGERKLFVYLLRVRLVAVTGNRFVLEIKAGDNRACREKKTGLGEKISKVYFSVQDRDELNSSNTDLHQDLKENRSADVKTNNDFLQTNTPAGRGSRKFSAPAALRFTRQLSVGGVGSSSGVHQNQNYYPFPSRKAPRISEAARRLGMYSSF